MYCTIRQRAGNRAGAAGDGQRQRDGSQEQATGNGQLTGRLAASEMHYDGIGGTILIGLPGPLQDNDLRRG